MPLPKVVKNAMPHALLGATSSLMGECHGSTPDGFINVGYTDTYLRVKAIHPRPLTNHLIPAQLGHYDDATQVIEGAVSVG